MTTTPLPLTWITLMPEAEQIVKGKHVYKRFIDGTPLSNDVPCWMVEFALEQVAQARADLEAENQRLRGEIDKLRKEALEPPTNKTHRCIKCLHAYWVGEGKNEDCPACGHDGTALEKQP